MQKIYKILAIVGLVVFLAVTVGGSIWIQSLLWRKAWYLAVSHLVVVGLAADPFADIVRSLISFIFNKDK